MCNPDAQGSIVTARHIDACTPSGSRRRRIWELSADSHCPIIGVCLPLPTLRKLMDKQFGQQSHSDYALHTCAVSVCGSRNYLSEVLQRELERRYAVLIQQFKAVKDSQTLVGRWQLAIESGDVAGAFWAGLTHPHCNVELQDKMIRDMHMLQHQAGATVRVDLAKMHAISKENGVLTRELGRIQERITRLVREKSDEILQLNTALMKIRGDNIKKESEIAFLRTDLARLEETMPDLQSRVQLVQQADKLKDRILELERSNTALKNQLALAPRRDEIQLDKSKETQKSPSLPAPVPAPAQLTAKTILCVGGRDASLSTYRELIECAGGKFEHHDGGREDNLKLLTSNLAAADLVICQTGCISHNAYWRVKDYCKRHGKPCVFVENPSASSLAKSIEALSRGEALRIVEEHCLTVKD